MLEPGEIVPCDGLFLGGHNVWCDESGVTGESDAIKKATFEECMSMLQKRWEEAGNTANLAHTDCFIVSGSKVLDGVGKYVVVAVGTKSFNGRIMMGTYVHGIGIRARLITGLSSVARRRGEYASSAQAKLSSRAHCETWQFGRADTIYCFDDSVFRTVGY